RSGRRRRHGRSSWVDASGSEHTRPREPPPRLASDVIAEHQLFGVRAAIELVGEIRQTEAADVMLEQPERDRERNQPTAILRDHLAELRPLVPTERALEEAG